MRQWAKLTAGRRVRLGGVIAAVAVFAPAVTVVACGATTVQQAGSGQRLTSAARHLASGSASGSASPAPGVSHAAAVKAKTAPRAVPPAATAPAHFRTLAPSAKLPSGAQCAAWVRARPLAESKGVNRRFNAVTGQHVGSHFFAAGDDPRAGRLLASRINGRFTGTTAEILRWAACKWGIDENIVFAQAAVESWWRQTAKGDFGTDPAACPPGHGPGADGTPGQCPQSYGILQNRFPFERASWPGIGRSTAMNADTAYAIWRSCFDGYETWLNNVNRGRQYQAGDAWGCVGRWFAGRWYASGAQQYISRVKTYLRQRIWRQPYFKQP